MWAIIESVVLIVWAWIILYLFIVDVGERNKK
jgi:hypothetical protein